MKRILSIITIFALILVLTTTSFAYNKESPPDSAANTYFIAFESKVDKDVIKSHGGEIRKQYKYMPVVTAKFLVKGLKLE